MLYTTQCEGKCYTLAVVALIKVEEVAINRSVNRDIIGFSN